MAAHLLPGVLVAISFSAAFSAAAFAAEHSPSRLVVKPLVLTAAMVGDCRASEETIARAQAESTRVWSHTDVTIKWVPPSEMSYDLPPSQWLVVRCGAAAMPVASSEAALLLPIATIRFVGALPTNTIVVNIENAIALLKRDAPEGPDQRGWFIPFRDIRLGRMLGRAIAHEIGHFLSQSGAHTRSGLMRASHTVGALTGASLAPFRAPDLSQY